MVPEGKWYTGVGNEAISPTLGRNSPSKHLAMDLRAVLQELGKYPPFVTTFPVSTSKFRGCLYDESL
jgi:hypothetical protein